MKRLIAKIYGDVQGVGFRYEAKRRADDLGLKGFARNEQDGSVYLEAEGGERKLNALLDWCRKGSEAAFTRKIDFKWSDELKNFSEFDTI